MNKIKCPNHGVNSLFGERPGAESNCTFCHGEMEVNLDSLGAIQRNHMREIIIRNALRRRFATNMLNEISRDVHG